MNVTDLLDPDVFALAEVDELQDLANACADAETQTEIEAAGEALDEARRVHREAMRTSASRSADLHALFKLLIREVPRRDVDGVPVGVVEEVAE